MRSNANLAFFAILALVLASVAVGPAIAQTPTADPTAPAEPTGPTGPVAAPVNITTPTNSTPTAPTKPPSYVAAFAPVPVVTSIIYGVCYAGLNILLIVGLVVLIAVFKRRITKRPSRANPGS